MANVVYKDMKFKVDNAAGSLTAITADVNNASLTGLQSLFEDTGGGDEERTYLPSLAGATLTLNGFINSTTDGIFGPLVGNRTSVNKTFSYGNGESYYTGESQYTNVQFSGSVDSGGLWSADFTITGAVTRTSVEPS